MEKGKISFGKILIGFLIVYVLFAMVNTKVEKEKDEEVVTYNDKIFSIITTQENKELEELINKFARKNAIEINITYADNLDIVEKINYG